MLRLFILVLGLSMLTACTEKREELRSPCVGADDSPCGERRNVNAWWTA